MRFAIIGALLLALTACYSSHHGNSGTGLVGGTVDNDLGGDIFKGLSESDARGSLNGDPLRARTVGSATCETYRGVDVGFSSGFKATGTLWVFCFAQGKVFAARHSCPNTWLPGEIARYKEADYGGDPFKC